MNEVVKTDWFQVLSTLYFLSVYMLGIMVCIGEWTNATKEKYKILARHTLLFPVWWLYPA